MVGTGMGAERGILIKNAEVLEGIRRLNASVLDKTGTLTEGRPQVVAVVPSGLLSEARLLTLTAAAESPSEHPLSRAIVDAAVESGYTLPGATEFESVVARGVSASVEDQQVLAGNVRLLEERGVEIPSAARNDLERLEAEGQTVILVAIDGRVEGVIGIADQVKQSAIRAVSALRSLGLRIIMMTGDNERAAAAVAGAVGIDEYRSGARPEDKLELVRDLQGEGLSVAMVGDGINDAPALAQADIGIAMSTGADAAIEAGDITLLHGDVSRLAEAVLLARSTLTTIRQNLVWAFGYNVMALPVASAGLLNPIIAGAAMAMSSVSVMANSLRLRTKAPRIARTSGNSYSGPRQSFVRANRGPIVAMGSAAMVLALPLLVFTGIDRGWFGDRDGPNHQGDLTVELRNWSVEPSLLVLNAGRVTILAIHPAHDDHGHGHGGHSGGGEVHDLVVLERLADGSTRFVARTPAIPVGEEYVLEVELAPGEYELLCDVVEQVDGQAVSHYENGMTVTIRVEG